MNQKQRIETQEQLIDELRETIIELRTAVAVANREADTSHKNAKRAIERRKNIQERMNKTSALVGVLNEALYVYPEIGEGRKPISFKQNLINGMLKTLSQIVYMSNEEIV